MSVVPVSGRPLLVVGVGNSLMTDDGIGIAALERLRAGWEFDPDIELVDCPWPLTLLPAVEESSGLLLIDAIDAKRAPGTVIELEGNEIPRYLDTKLSPHQVGVRELLALCSLRGCLPVRTAALRSEEHTSELQSLAYLVCRLLLEKK